MGKQSVSKFHLPSNNCGTRAFFLNRGRLSMNKLVIELITLLFEEQHRQHWVSSTCKDVEY